MPFDALAPRAEGITVHSVHAPSIQFEGQLFSASKRVRDDAEVLFRRVCYVGNILGAKYYTFHGPINSNLASPQVDIMRYAERMNILCEIARTYGLFVAQENVHYCQITKPDAFKVLLEQCQNLRTTLDVKHAVLSDIEPIKFLDIMQDRLATVHVIDVSKDGNTYIPGQGKFNFEKLFKEITKRKIECVALIEAYRKNFKELTELKNGYNHLKEILNNI